MINSMIDASSGRILVDGQDIAKVDPPELRRRIGYVIQQIGLFPYRTIGDNIATVPELVGWDKRRTEARGRTAGGGRLACRGPRPLPAPSSPAPAPAGRGVQGPGRRPADHAHGRAARAADPIVRSRLQDEFLRLQQEVRKTIVFVTHDIDEAIKMGDRIAIFRQAATWSSTPTSCWPSRPPTSWPTSSGPSEASSAWP